jgi:hypothetical protein
VRATPLAQCRRVRPRLRRASWLRCWISAYASKHRPHIVLRLARQRVGRPTIRDPLVNVPWPPVVRPERVLPVPVLLELLREVSLTALTVLCLVERVNAERGRSTGHELTRTKCPRTRSFDLSFVVVMFVAGLGLPHSLHHRIKVERCWARCWGDLTWHCNLPTRRWRTGWCELLRDRDVRLCLTCIRINRRCHRRERRGWRSLLNRRSLWRTLHNRWRRAESSSDQCIFTCRHVVISPARLRCHEAEPTPPLASHRGSLQC